MRLIPRLKPWIGGREIRAAMGGRKGVIPEFEKAFAEKFDTNHGVMFSHGRAGLHAFFKAMGLDQAEVICPAYTCVVVQHAIVLSGNIPVFVDCAEGSFNMDLDLLEKEITAETRTVVVTHLFGYPMDVERCQAIVAAAEEKYGHKIWVIQDVAHSYGARWNDQLVTSFGDCAIFGCNVSKIMTSVFGGMLITKSQEVADKVRSHRDQNYRKASGLKGFKRFLYLLAIRIAFNHVVYAFTNWLERSGILNRFVKYYDEGVIDFPGDWDELPCDAEARVGLVQLAKYDQIIAKRRAASERYTAHFEQCDDITVLPMTEGATYSHYVGVVENRQAWVDRFRKHKVQLGILIEYSVPEMAAYQKYKRGEYPRSAYYSEHCINLPNWPNVPEFKLD